MQALPHPTEQHWILASLAALMRQRGHEPFLTHPIVEPTPEFFPDPWTYSSRGLDRVTRRLMQYAGLSHLDIVLYEECPPDAGSTEGAEHCSVAGRFLGIEAGRCHFVFNVKAPADAEYMAGVMAHEVAHAYRSVHGLNLADRRQEELLTDLTACYLGFGILVANVSHRYRTAGGVVGALVQTTTRAGYLTSQAHSYLLGLQLIVRDASLMERRRVLRHLEPNQAAFTRAAITDCNARSQDFPQVLNLPPRATWPGPSSPSDILLPLPEFVDAQGMEDAAEPVAPSEGDNVGRPVFRLPRRRTDDGAILGAIGGTVLGLAIPIDLPRAASVVIGIALGVVAGGLAGRRRTYDVCAGAECGKYLAPERSSCPHCGGRISGSIARLIDRFDAEEALQRQRPPDSA